MKKAVSLILVFVLAFSFSSVAFAEEEFKPYPDSRFFEYGDYNIHYRVIPAKSDFKGFTASFVRHFRGRTWLTK